MPSKKIDLKGLQSESRNVNSLNIDLVTTEELCQIINNEDRSVADAVTPCLPVIAKAIDTLTEVTRRGGKVIYVGAGTSGRLGVLDASELPPTFSARPEQFVALIAGGDRALRHAQEGAEDDGEQAVRDMQATKLQSGDALIGIAASGRTPYVLSCLSYGRQIGCTTVAVACSSPSAMGRSGHVDFMIEAVTGAEVVTGSTRMKAGTATKMVLNMLSTGVQIRLGKTFGNMMVDVKATNLKLEERARNILREVCGKACPTSDAELDELLHQSGGSVKLAIAMIHLGASADIARKSLDEANGVLGTIMRGAKDEQQSRTNGVRNIEYVLCVDGGGSKCAAYVMASSGELGVANGAACNVTTASLQTAAATIQRTVMDAVRSCESLRGRALEDIPFARVWIGLAGFDRAQVAAKLTPMLEKLFHPDSRSNLKITNDLELLATAAGGKDSRDVCVLVAGTGSIAMVFRRTSTGYSKIGRIGGWGPLLGDEGSGFDIGRHAIRHVLEVYDGGSQHNDRQDTLVDAVLQHFNLSSSEEKLQDLLSSVLISSGDDGKDPRQRIADVAKVVIQQQTSSAAASKMVAASLASLMRLVNSATKSTSIDSANTVLVMTGGLLNASSYRDQLERAITGSGLIFHKTEVVERPGLLGAQCLLSSIK